MKIRRPGDKTKIVCEVCQQIRPATWRYGKYELHDGAPVDEVMMAFCDTCDTPWGIATQSAWRIRQAKEQQQKQRTSAMVTLPLQDLAAMKLSAIGGDPKRGPELMTMAILRLLSAHPKRVAGFARELQKLDATLFDGPTKKVNLYLTKDHVGVLDELAEATQLNKSEVIRRALVVTQTDPEIDAELMKAIGVRAQSSGSASKALGKKASGKKTAATHRGSHGNSTKARSGHAALQRIAREERRSVDDITREAISEYIARRRKTRRRPKSKAPASRGS